MKRKFTKYFSLMAAASAFRGAIADAVARALVGTHGSAVRAGAHAAHAAVHTDQSKMHHDNKTNFMHHEALVAVAEAAVSRTRAADFAISLPRVHGASRSEGAAPEANDLVRAVEAALSNSSAKGGGGLLFSKVRADGKQLLFTVDNSQLFTRVLQPGAVLDPAVRRRNHQPKVAVEFSSPNIAKPFHAGHLRSTIIGG